MNLLDCVLFMSLLITVCIQKNVLIQLASILGGAFAAYCSKPHLELTISPTSGRVEVNWDLEDWTQGDKISIFLGNVIDQPHKLLPTTTLDTSGHVGWKDTKVPFSISMLKFSGYKRQCLNVSALYWRPTGNQKESIVATCLQSLPDWMEHYREKLAKMKLLKLFIPGTHNSGAFKSEYSFSFVDAELKEMYLFNQQLPVLNQLTLGSRFLDLRVKRQKRSSRLSDEDWVLIHSSYRLFPAIQVINDIVTFLRNTEEIIVVDIHRFDKSVTKEDIMDFASYLDHYMSEFWAKPEHNLSWHSTLQDFWTKKKRLVVSLNHIQTVITKPSSLMLPVAQVWVNKDNIKDMEEALRLFFNREDDYYYYYTDYYNGIDKNTIEDSGNRKKDLFSSESMRALPLRRWLTFGWAVMAEMTLKGGNILSLPMQSVRKKAAEVNPWLNRWFRRFSWGQRLCNIVAVDYLEGTGIVRAAIDSNLMRASGDECYSYTDYKDGYTQTIYKP